MLELLGQNYINKTIYYRSRKGFYFIIMLTRTTICQNDVHFYWVEIQGHVHRLQFVKMMCIFLLSGNSRSCSELGFIHMKRIEWKWHHVVCIQICWKPSHPFKLQICEFLPISWLGWALWPLDLLYQSPLIIDIIHFVIIIHINVKLRFRHFAYKRHRIL